MHKQNFVMAVKVGGKVLREFDNSVYIPFGSEYSILLKNVSNRKAKVTVFIDGQDALDGTALIIDARSDVDLKRFIKNGNFEHGNSFKFIEKTSKIEQHRGNKAEDGLITIHYEFEQEMNLQGSLGKFGSDRYRGISDYGYKPSVYYSSNTSIYDPTSQQEDFYFDSLSAAPMAAASMSFSVDSGSEEVKCSSKTLRSRCMTKPAVTQNASLPQNTAGITAPGSISDQKFGAASWLWGDGVKHTMTLELKGAVDEQVLVTKEVTVTRLKRCSMCGTNVRQVAKFCHECGSSVEIV